MCLNMFLRLFADSIVFFALLGCCPTLLPYSYPLPLASLIFGLCAFLSCFLEIKGMKKLSRACAILPLLTLLLARSWLETLVLIPPILYVGIVIFRDQISPEYYLYRAFFKRSLSILIAAWAAISIAIFIEDPTGKAQLLIDPSIILRYIILYFLCGVVLQRQLRMGVERRTRGEVGQITSMLGSIGVVSASFILTEPILRESSFSALRNIFSILSIPVQIFLDVIYYLVEKLKEMYSSEKYIEQRGEGNPTPLESLNQHLQNVEPVEEEAKVIVVTPEHSPWVMVIAVVAVIAIVILMAFAFTRLLRHRRATLTFAATGDPERKKGAASRHSNRFKVRQMYREYLHREQNRGVKIKKQHTTEDILRNLSEGTDRAAAAALRSIYLSARYDEATDVERTQVSQARDALKRIRKSESTRKEHS